MSVCGGQESQPICQILEKLQADRETAVAVCILTTPACSRMRFKTRVVFFFPFGINLPEVITAQVFHAHAAFHFDTKNG